MVPVAPGRSSTMKFWPWDSFSFCAAIRARMSVEPPAGNGTTIRTIFAGYSWAMTAPANNPGKAGRMHSKRFISTSSFVRVVRTDPRESDALVHSRAGVHQQLVNSVDAHQAQPRVLDFE